MIYSDLEWPLNLVSRLFFSVCSSVYIEPNCCNSWWVYWNCLLACNFGSYKLDLISRRYFTFDTIFLICAMFLSRFEVECINCVGYASCAVYFQDQRMFYCLEVCVLCDEGSTVSQQLAAGWSMVSGVWTIHCDHCDHVRFVSCFLVEFAHNLRCKVLSPSLGKGWSWDWRVWVPGGDFL